MVSGGGGRERDGRVGMGRGRNFKYNFYFYDVKGCGWQPYCLKVQPVLPIFNIHFLVFLQ
jgi:hypothetical protein